MASAASDGPAPSIRNACSRWRSAPSSTQAPTTPLTMIMTAAYIVSRGERRLVFAAGEHHRDDQRRFDRRDGECQDQRAERLADAMRDDLGVMHGGDDDGDQRHAAGGHEQRTDGHLQRDAEQRHAEQWNECGPVGHLRLPPMSVAHLY